jgi:CIC family chloride channel protein
MLGDSLILAGMAALSASVIGAPIASIVIIFELTHSYDLAFVSIICVAGSCLISSLVFGHSFFDKQLLNRRFKISRGRTEILLSERPITNLLGKNKFLAMFSGASKEEFMKAFQNSEFTEAYIIDKSDRLIGKIKVNDLLGEKKKVKSNPNPLTINSSSTVSDAIIKASNFVGESIPVIKDDKTLLGVVTEADLFSEYLHVQDAISKIERD